MRRHLLILAACTLGWGILATGALLYVDRKIRQAAGWLA